jgi:hypothetical protein
LPAIFPLREYALAGGPMSYGSRLGYEYHPQNRQGARPYHPGNAVGDRRRGYPVTGGGMVLSDGGGECPNLFGRHHTSVSIVVVVKVNPACLRAASFDAGGPVRKLFF